MMKNFRHFRSVILRFFHFSSAVCLFVSLSACLSVPNADLASGEQDAQYKRFVPQADQASIYIFRSELWEGHIKTPIKLNERPVGSTTAKTFLYQSVPAGDYRITAQADNIATLNVRVEAGKIYYVYQSMKFTNAQTDTRLQLVDEKQGQAGVLVSALLIPKATVELKDKQTQGKEALVKLEQKSDKVDFILSHAHFQAALKQQLDQVWQRQDKQLNDFVDQQLQLRKQDRSQLSKDKQKVIGLLIKQYSQVESMDSLLGLYRSKLPGLSEANLTELKQQVEAGGAVLRDSQFIKISQDLLDQRALAAFGQFVAEILPVFSDLSNQK
jgi:hypothetical protein